MPASHNFFYTDGISRKLLRDLPILHPCLLGTYSLVAIPRPTAFFMCNNEGGGQRGHGRPLLPPARRGQGFVADRRCQVITSLTEWGEVIIMWRHILLHMVGFFWPDQITPAPPFPGVVRRHQFFFDLKTCEVGIV